MLNSFDSNNAGSYFDLRGKLVKKMKTLSIEKQISEILLSSYEQALKSEDVVLSKLEKNRLMADISAEILNELAKVVKSN